jgi:exopolyphosphatase / guanosine-5'-triphosphate,3'-diphosphate pyrophosphatase
LFVHQLFCLRLAVILCHARRDPDLKGLQACAAGRQVAISMRPEWAQAFPQSAHLLREEVLAWQKTPWTLVLA